MFFNSINESFPELPISTTRLPVRVPPANGNLVAILFVMVVEKFASSPIAAANSLSVSSVEGAESVIAAITAD